MSTDYYSEVRQIIAQLSSEGLSPEANALKEAMEAGATGTEILTRLRWELRQIDAATRPIGLNTKRKIHELIIALDQALA